MALIDALVTAGGKGTRMKGVEGEKPLLPVLGRPMVDRVLDALRSSASVGTVYASVSDNAPRTREHLRGQGVTVVETLGAGYVIDLNQAMGRISAPLVLVCPADMPLLSGRLIDEIESHYLRAGVASLSVAVPAEVVRSLGAAPSFTLDVDGLEAVLCGVSVVDRVRMLTEEVLSQGYMISRDERFALNINTPDDLAAAERWLSVHGWD